MPIGSTKKRFIDIKSDMVLCHFWRTITPVARAVKVLWGINRATVNCQRVPRSASYSTVWLAYRVFAKKK